MKEVRVFDNFITGWLCGIIVLGSVFILMQALWGEEQFEMMHCQEDEVIYGTGDFSDGVWESYSCEVEDDLYEMNRQWVHDEAYANGWADGHNGESFGGDK